MPPPWSIKRILRHNRAQIMEAGRTARSRLAPPISPAAAARRGGPNPSSSSSPTDAAEPPRSLPRLEVIQSSILFRHGDRSPSHNMFEPETRRAAREAFAWASELPSDAVLADLDRFAPARHVSEVQYLSSLSTTNTSTSTATAATTSAKPVLGTANAVHQKSLRPRDAELGSFGRLSRIGLYQALDLGAWLQGFYAPAHNAAIRATSSNYARTINTAQAVLRNFLPGDAPAGALPVRVHSPADEYLNVYPFFPDLQRRMAQLTQEGWFQDFDLRVLRERRRLEQLFPSFAFQLRKFSWLACQDHFRCRELRQGRIERVFSSEEQHGEESAHGEDEGGGRDDATRYNDGGNPIDSFEVPGRKGAGVGLGGAQWKDSWLFRESTDNMKMAFRRFDKDGDGSLSKQEVFRAAEELLPKSCLSPRDLERLFDILDARQDGKVSWEEFSAAMGEAGLPTLSRKRLNDAGAGKDGLVEEEANDDEEELWSLRPVVEEYTIKRFSMWYEDDSVREMATGGLVEALVRAQDNAIRRQSTRRRGRTRPAMQFNLMCGHDVTVLPLLHVLGATREANTWPAYCCTLMVELLRCPEEGDYYVRTLWHPGRTGVGVDDSPYCEELEMMQDTEEKKEDPEGFRSGATLIRLDDFRKLADGPVTSNRKRHRVKRDIPALV